MAQRFARDKRQGAGPGWRRGALTALLLVLATVLTACRSGAGGAGGAAAASKPAGKPSVRSRASGQRARLASSQKSESRKLLEEMLAEQAAQSKATHPEGAPAAAAKPAASKESKDLNYEDVDRYLKEIAQGPVMRGGAAEQPPAKPAGAVAPSAASSPLGPPGGTATTSPAQAAPAAAPQSPGAAAPAPPTPAPAAAAPAAATAKSGTTPPAPAASSPPGGTAAAAAPAAAPKAAGATSPAPATSAPAAAASAPATATPAPPPQAAGAKAVTPAAPAPAPGAVAQPKAVVAASSAAPGGPAAAPGVLLATNQGVNPAVQVQNQAAAPAQATPPPEAPKQRPPRPAGKSVFYSFFHKSADDFVRFLQDQFPDYVEKGHVATVDGMPKTAMFFGDDPTIAIVTNIANEFDDLNLKLERITIRPKYIDIGVLMESLHMAGIANVWNRIEATMTTTTPAPDGKSSRSESHKQSAYTRSQLAGGAPPPADLPAKIPYIFELPWTEPFQVPKITTGKGTADQMSLSFDSSPSSELRGMLVAVGTSEDLARIQNFMKEVDRPARLIMIEVQLIELDANKFSDIGIDSFQVGDRHGIIGWSSNFPGEAISQPGIPGATRRDGRFVPQNVSSGLSYLFDDTTVDLTGRFLFTLNLMERTGDATVKARPKILALDDRQAILHVGEEIPSFESTGVSRELTGGNFIESINRVTTQYVGFTLNMRPKITGEKDDQVSLNLEVASNRLVDRRRVFEQDLLGIPEVTRRRFVGETRVQNHRPIILGGLIEDQDTESVSKIPFLGEVPVLKWLFSRTQKTSRRVEVILILTPHILSDKIPDRMATPKESQHFDTFDSVLFNDRHIIKGRDVWGIDPVSKQPAVRQKTGIEYTKQDVIDLTLLKIVKDRKLVSKLSIFEEYLPDESRKKLGWIQRKFPERSIYYWPEDRKEVYYKAAAIVIENIKELNPDLTFDDIVMPRREIVLPTTPYRMTLSYDKWKTYQQNPEVLRSGRAELTEAAVDHLQEIAEIRTIRQFAEYIEKKGIKATDHGEIASELVRLYQAMNPGNTEPIDPSDYAGLYRKLADSRIDFMAIATYFRQNLTGRYKTMGAPNMGAFEFDLVEFLKGTYTITQQAKRLRDLEIDWTSMYSSEEEEAEAQEYESVEEPPDAGS